MALEFFSPEQIAEFLQSRSVKKTWELIRKALGKILPGLSTQDYSDKDRNAEEKDPVHAMEMEVRSNLKFLCWTEAYKSGAFRTGLYAGGGAALLSTIPIQEIQIIRDILWYLATIMGGTRFLVLNRVIKNPVQATMENLSRDDDMIDTTAYEWRQMEATLSPPIFAGYLKFMRTDIERGVLKLLREYKRDGTRIFEQALEAETARRAGNTQESLLRRVTGHAPEFTEQEERRVRMIIVNDKTKSVARIRAAFNGISSPLDPLPKPAAADESGVPELVGETVKETVQLAVGDNSPLPEIAGDLAKELAKDILRDDSVTAPNQQVEQGTPVILPAAQIVPEISDVTLESRDGGIVTAVRTPSSAAKESPSSDTESDETMLTDDRDFWQDYWRSEEDGWMRIYQEDDVIPPQDDLPRDAALDLASRFSDDPFLELEEDHPVILQSRQTDTHHRSPARIRQVKELLTSGLPPPLPIPSQTMPAWKTFTEGGDHPANVSLHDLSERNLHVRERRRPLTRKVS